MPILTDLQTRLSWHCRRRERLARAAAAAQAALAAAAVLLGLCLLDWLTEWGRSPRAWALAAACALWAWLAWRTSTAWNRPGPGPLDLAVAIGHQQNLDDDLVAALEFETAPARSESLGLRLAVVEYVADFSRTMQLAPAAWPRRLTVSVLAGGVIAVVVSLAAILYPTHAQVFGDRLLLGHSHYPTRCRIESLSANGRPALNKVVRLAEQEPVQFRVRAAGDLPTEGHIWLASKTGRWRTRLALRSDGNGQYAGALPQLTEPTKGTLFLGDAWSDPFELTPAPRPVVALIWKISPPAYARAANSSQAPTDPGNQARFDVLLGSGVSLRLNSLNGPLDQVYFRAGNLKLPLSPTDGQRGQWRLPAAKSPLESIDSPLRYSILVVDAGGLEPAAPIEGEIRLKSDLAPHLTMSVVSRHVLPNARPVVSYAADDDIALRSLRLKRRTLKTDGHFQTTSIPLPLGRSPPKSLRGQFALELAELKLAKGDRLQLTLEAEDDRGPSAGQVAASEPLVLHVTDERGVLDAMNETDTRSADRLDAIIDTQIRSGDPP